MKKNILLFMLLLPAITFAQLNTDVYLGYDSKGHAIAVWSVGYEKGILAIQGEIRPSLTRKTEAGNYMGFRLSANIVNPDEEGVYIMPGVAYLYDLRSSDKKSLNKWYWAPVLKTGLMLNEKAGLGFDIAYINKSFQAAFGLHYKFD